MGGFVDSARVDWTLLSFILHAVRKIDKNLSISMAFSIFYTTFAFVDVG